MQLIFFIASLNEVIYSVAVELLIIKMMHRSMLVRWVKYVKYAVEKPVLIIQYTLIQKLHIV